MENYQIGSANLPKYIFVCRLIITKDKWSVWSKSAQLAFHSLTMKTVQTLEVYTYCLYILKDHSSSDDQDYTYFIQTWPTQYLDLFTLSHVYLCLYMNIYSYLFTHQPWLGHLARRHHTIIITNIIGSSYPRGFTPPSNVSCCTHYTHCSVPQLLGYSGSVRSR